jgi:hypothetical protein
VYVGDITEGANTPPLVQPIPPAPQDVVSGYASANSSSSQCNDNGAGSGTGGHTSRYKYSYVTIRHYFRFHSRFFFKALMTATKFSILSKYFYLFFWQETHLNHKQMNIKF